MFVITTLTHEGDRRDVHVFQRQVTVTIRRKGYLQYNVKILLVKGKVIDKLFALGGYGSDCKYQRGA